MVDFLSELGKSDGYDRCSMDLGRIACEVALEQFAKDGTMKGRRTLAFLLTFPFNGRVSVFLGLHGLETSDWLRLVLRYKVGDCLCAYDSIWHGFLAEGLNWATTACKAESPMFSFNPSSDEIADR